MKLKLLGFVHSKGEYTDKQTGEVNPYDSVVLDCVTAMSAKGPSVVSQGGEHYKKVKFKNIDTAAIFCGAIKTPAELVEYVGKRIVVEGMQYNTPSGPYIAAEEIYLDEH